MAVISTRTASLAEMTITMDEACEPVMPGSFGTSDQPEPSNLPGGNLEALVAGWVKDASRDPYGSTVSDARVQAVRSALDTLMHHLQQRHEQRHDGVRASAKHLGGCLTELFRTSSWELEKAHRDLLAFVCDRESDGTCDRMLMIEMSAAFAAGSALRSRRIALASDDLHSPPVLEVIGRIQRALFRSEDRFWTVFDASGEGLCLADLNRNLLAANQTLLDMLGYEAEEFLEQRPGDLVTRHTRRTIEEIEQLLSGQREHVEFETELMARAGRLQWSLLSLSLIRARDGSPRYIIALVRDISDLKRSEAVIRETDQRLRELIRNSSDVITVITEDGIMEFMSPSIQRMLGYEPKPLIGQSFTELIAEESRATLEFILDDLRYRPRQTTRAEMRALHHDGSWRWLEVVCTNLIDVDDVGGIVVNARDVTDRKTFEQHLERQAFYDSLTALPNRLAFRERLEGACVRASSAGSAVAVLFLDLDRFKMINDSLGHGGGDQTLVAVGQRILDTLQDGEIVARFGGDEFAVMIEAADGDRATQAATRIHRALQRPMPIGHRDALVEVSIGIALSDEILVTGADLIRASDIASYRAKSLGGATTVMFDHPMASESMARIDLEVGLHNALAQQEIEPWFQPEIDLRTGEVRGLEVLMRWHRPGHGVVLPSTFLAIADDTGLIVSLGRHIMEQTFTQVSAWERDDVIPAHLPISLNLSGRELRAADFLEAMERLLVSTRVDPHRIQLEITDAVSAVATQARSRVVQRLLELGMQFTIDRYGIDSGLIDQVRCVCASKVKVDASFMGAPRSADVDTVILTAVVDVASRIGVEVAMVGLETEQQVSWAREAGCLSGQGPAFAEPMPAKALTAYLSASH